MHEEMPKRLKFKFLMDPKSMLLNILPSNITRKHSELVKYKLMVTFTTKWKAERSREPNEWKRKLTEYASMA